MTSPCKAGQEQASGRDPRGRFAVGVSGNPRGRKPVGETAAAAARQKLTPEQLAEKLLKLADGATSEQVRLGALLALAERGYGKVTNVVDINRDERDDDDDLSRLSLDELRVWLALKEKTRPDADATGQQPDGAPTTTTAAVAPVPSACPEDA